MTKSHTALLQDAITQVPELAEFPPGILPIIVGYNSKHQLLIDCSDKGIIGQEAREELILVAEKASHLMMGRYNGPKLASRLREDNTKLNQDLNDKNLKQFLWDACAVFSNEDFLQAIADDAVDFIKFISKHHFIDQFHDNYYRYNKLTVLHKTGMLGSIRCMKYLYDEDLPIDSPRAFLTAAMTGVGQTLADAEQSIFLMPESNPHKQCLNYLIEKIKTIEDFSGLLSDFFWSLHKPKLYFEIVALLFNHGMKVPEQGFTSPLNFDSLSYNDLQATASRVTDPTNKKAFFKIALELVANKSPALFKEILNKTPEEEKEVKKLPARKISKDLFKAILKEYTSSSCFGSWGLFNSDRSRAMEKLRQLSKSRWKTEISYRDVVAALRPPSCTFFSVHASRFMLFTTGKRNADTNARKSTDDVILMLHQAFKRSN